MNKQTVYVPCDEHDENCSGGYTSYDGQSLCHVSPRQAVILSEEEVEFYYKCIELLLEISRDEYAQPHEAAKKLLSELNNKK